MSWRLVSCSPVVVSGLLTVSSLVPRRRGTRGRHFGGAVDAECGGSGNGAPERAHAGSGGGSMYLSVVILRGDLR